MSVQIDEARQDYVLVVKLHDAGPRRVEGRGPAGHDLSRPHDQARIVCEGRVRGVEELPTPKDCRVLGLSGPLVSSPDPQGDENSGETQATKRNHGDAEPGEGHDTPASYERQGVGINPRCVFVGTVLTSCYLHGSQCPSTPKASGTKDKRRTGDFGSRFRTVGCSELSKTRPDLRPPSGGRQYGFGVHDLHTHHLPEVGVEERLM
jgi:hypothetical protein